MLKASSTQEAFQNEPDSHWQLHRAQAQGTEFNAGAAGAAARCVQNHRRNGCIGLYLGYSDGPFGCGNPGGDRNRRKAHARKIVLIKSAIKIERGSPG